MKSSNINGIVLATLCLLALAVIQDANAEGIIAKSTSFEKTTIVEFENDSNVDVEVFKFWLAKTDLFKSFKTEQGWIGSKSTQGVLTFTSDQAIKIGQTIKFGVKTDTQKPGINWQALDNQNQQIDIGKTIPTQTIQKPIEQPDDNIIDEPKETGIKSESVFKLVPEKPKIGSSIRVVGEKFGIEQDLELYIDDTKLESFQSNSDGHFMITTEIPDNIKEDRVDFMIKDSDGQEKKISLRITQQDKTQTQQEHIPLTINGLPTTIQRGELLIITGTAMPSSSVTATILTPGGNIITTNASKVGDSGTWGNEFIVPIDIELGRYTAEITDGAETITRQFTVDSLEIIKIRPNKIKFEPGDNMIFNITALPNQDLEIVIKNPQNTEVIAEIISIDQSGMGGFEFQTSFSDLQGTYIMFATQGDDTGISLVGLGELPEIQIVAKMDKLNYGIDDDTATITLNGPPSTKISLLIIDSADQDRHSDTISLGVDGKNVYELDLKNYPSDIYTSVFSRGNSETREIFGVKLSISEGRIDASATKQDYTQGEAILIQGSTDSNVLLTLKMLDPSGDVVNEKEAFTNKEGTLSINSIRVPINAQYGTWTINIQSGQNFKNISIEVIPDPIDGMTVFIESVENNREIGGDIVHIKVVGAKQSVSVNVLSSSGDNIKKQQVSVTGADEAKIPWLIQAGTAPGLYTITAKDAFNMANTTYNLLPP